MKRCDRFSLCFSDPICKSKIMLYKPKFCCSCGEDIERVDWGWFASRRFCELCETQHKVYDLVPRLLVVLGLLTGVLGFGFYWQKAENAAAVSSHQINGSHRSADKNSAAQTNSLQLSANQNVQETARTQGENFAVQPQNKMPAAFVKPSLPAARQTGQTENQPVAAAEKTYFCGAETKKGTPCSRRVKGKERCWQHAGQAAMLPPEKLIAEN